MSRLTKEETRTILEELEGSMLTDMQVIQSIVENPGDIKGTNIDDLIFESDLLLKRAAAFKKTVENELKGETA